MSEMGDDFKAWDDMKKAKKAQNKCQSTKLLQDKCIEFESKNFGTHLVVSGSKKIDFWPSTGLWMIRGNPYRFRGVKHLIKHVEKSRTAEDK